MMMWEQGGLASRSPAVWMDGVPFRVEGTPGAATSEGPGRRSIYSISRIREVSAVIETCAYERFSPSGP